MPRGVRKKKVEIKSLDAATEQDVFNYLTQTAFIQAYSAFNLKKMTDGLQLTAVIDGQTFDLTFVKKNARAKENRDADTKG
jgi:hypothetical protein